MHYWVAYQHEHQAVYCVVDLHALTTGRTPESVADDYSQYGPLKADTADAVNELLDPIRARYQELSADPAETTRLLDVGADKARTVAAATLNRAQTNAGLLPRSPTPSSA